MKNLNTEKYLLSSHLLLLLIGQISVKSIIKYIMINEAIN